MRDPELAARAQRAATRLESAREQWRALHGLAVAPGQPVVSYVGYSLKEPGGEPRVVIGIDADEAGYLAEFLDRDECAQRGQARFSRPLTARGNIRVRCTSTRRPPPTGGRPSPDQARDIAAELAGWTPGELPGQLPEQLASWPPGVDQPPAGA